MYHLTLHIEYLLLRHDCVVVPGIGAFINSRRPAQFDAERKVWLPMTREVRFNGALTHDDGLLANSFARKNKLSFEEGRDMLRKAVAQLRDALDTDGEVTVGHLGILQSNSGTLSFLPMQSAEQAAMALGYSEAPLQCAPKAAAAVAEIPLEDAASETPVAEEVQRERRFDTRRNYYIGINKVFAHVAASIIVVAVVALSIILPEGIRDNVDMASVVPVEKIIRKSAPKAAAKPAATDVPAVSTPAKENPAASLERPGAATAQTAPEQSAAAAVQPKAVTGPEKVSEKRFYAIVATFNSRQEAESFIRQHAGQGFALQVVSSGKKSRVSAMSGNEKESLLDRMRNKEFRALYPDAWIWTAN